MVNQKIETYLLWRYFLLIFIAIFIFIYSESYEKYTKIEDFTNSIPLVNDQGLYYDITQNYPTIELEGFDSILNKLFHRIKYSDICFRDDGSEIIESAFKGSNLLISVTYSNQTKEVSYKTSRKKTNFSEEQCFKIVDKKRITWNWKFSSENPITKGFLEVKAFESIIISPKVSTYLKVNNFYYVFAGFLSLFYSGIFLWALTRICKYLREGFK